MAGARLLLWGGPFNSPSLNNEIVHSLWGGILQVLFTEEPIEWSNKGSVCYEYNGQKEPSLSEYFDCSEN